MDIQEGYGLLDEPGAEVDERMQSEGIEGASAFELETVMAFFVLQSHGM